MKKLLVTTICLLGAHLLSAGEIWISPQGNDLNDGTRPSPKATLTSALRQAREWRRTDENGGGEELRSVWKAVRMHSMNRCLFVRKTAGRRILPR